MMSQEAKNSSGRGQEKMWYEKHPCSRLCRIMYLSEANCILKEVIPATLMDRDFNQSKNGLMMMMILQR